MLLKSAYNDRFAPIMISIFNHYGGCG